MLYVCGRHALAESNEEKLPRALANLQTAENKYGKGHPGTQVALQDLARVYAVLKNPKCLEVLERIYQIAKNNPEPQRYFRPKQIEMWYHYEIEDNRRAAQHLVEVFQILHRCDFTDGWKAQYMMESMDYARDFFDEIGYSYAIKELKNLLTASRSLDANQRHITTENIRRAEHNLKGIIEIKKMAGESVEDVFLDEKSFLAGLDKISQGASEESETNGGKSATYDPVSDFEANRARFMETARKDPAAFQAALLVAISYRNAEDWSKAEELFSELDLIVSKSPSLDSEAHLEIPNHLSAVYQNIGNFEKALEMSENGLRRLRQISAKEQDSLPATLSNIAYLQARLGKKDEFHKTVVDLLAAMQAHGPAVKRATGMPVEIFLVNLAHSHELLGESARARELFEEALLKLQSFLASKSKQKGTTENVIQFDMVRSWEQTALLGLAQIHQREGRTAESEKILEAMRPLLKTRKNQNSTFHRAAMHCGALNALALNDIGAARQRFESLAASQDAYMETVAALPEEDLLAWQKEFHDSSLAAAVLGDVDFMEFLLRRKGLVYGLMVERRKLATASRNPLLAKDWKNLAVLRSKLGQLSIAPETDPAEIAALRSQIADVERRLGKSRAESNSLAKITSPLVPQIATALLNRSCLVDFFIIQEKADGKPSVGAIILAPDGQANRVDFGAKADMDILIQAFHTAIADGDEESLRRASNRLTELLLTPLLAALPEGTERLFISPDGEFNFLPFAALLDSNGLFVAEKYSISYVGSARDLTKKPSETIPKSMALIANPQFDSNTKTPKTTEHLAIRSAEADVFGSFTLAPLPGTVAEATALEAIAAQSGWQTKSYLGINATESSVRNTKRPGVLHLATHGFYLNSFMPTSSEGSRGMSVVRIQETAEEKKKKGKGVDPMRASGVALTGAQQTLASWSQKKAPHPETDGVLTAEEVGALRLDGTWMVVLSACETGVGEARSGEGVFGLRRAFMIAGAENLLMTLWPVADETTAKLMTDFYIEAFATGDAPGSLAKVQRDWLVKLRQERGLLAAVREAGPFAMVTMTNPNAQREFVEGQLEVAPEKAAIPKSDKILEFQVALAKADAGDAYAQAIVSIYYGLGMGCDQDPAKSKDYVMLSAKQQNPLGIYRLAEMRESGEGMDQNSEQALQLMKKAKPGLQKLSTDPYALTALATIYERENPASPKIRELLTKASDMGYEPAQEKLNQLPTNK
jgi:CHAT domain-containing protein